MLRKQLKMRSSVESPARSMHFLFVEPFVVPVVVKFRMFAAVV
jgi:hypothetical protein